MSTMSKDKVNIDQLSTILGVSRDTIVGWVKRNKIPYFRTVRPSRVWFNVKRVLSALNDGQAKERYVSE